MLCMRFVYPSHDCRHSDPPTACILIDVYVFSSSPKLGTEPCCVNTLSSKRAWAASSALCSDPWLCATLVVRLVDTGNIIQTQSPQQCRMIFFCNDRQSCRYKNRAMRGDRHLYISLVAASALILLIQPGLVAANHASIHVIWRSQV